MSGTLSRDAVIVGASVAGLHEAETVAKVERELTVTAIGEEAHPPYERPPLSKTALTQPMDLDALSLRSFARLRDEGARGPARETGTVGATHRDALRLRPRRSGAPGGLAEGCRTQSLGRPSPASCRAGRHFGVRRRRRSGLHRW
ncbi:FAD-dependent oxidoreductase [Streptomyces himalayensis]|uniref:FAD-dependent oxidoreductase n=1 Tax=Streptomyces himalayensis TaxID=2820085 RepID=UPI001FE86C4E|nr:FAD-dependent oxidoreductase [Streptomyces himalayensis]